MEEQYMSELPVVGVLLGNSAGVGPELVAKLAVSNYYADYCRPVIIGDGLKGTDDIGVPVAGGEYVKEARIGRAIMDADIFISL